MRLKDLGVRHKLVAFAMAISTAALVLASAIDLWANARAAEHTVRNRLRAHADVLAVSLAPAVAAGNQAAIEQTLRGLSALTEIDNARVVDLGGRLVAEYTRDPATERMRAPVLRQRRDVRAGGQVLGQVELTTARRAIRELIAESSAVTAATVGVCLVFAYALAARLQRLMSRPVAQVAEAARRVSAERDYSLRVDYDGRDEFGRLTDAFNGMLEQVQRRDQELEEQVRGRTEELVRLNERLKHQAYHDALTKLPNRALFDDRLTLAIAQSERDDSKVAVMFLDLDNFKAINDSLGHDYGDELLRQVALRIRNAVRRIDTVARLGGDEFTVVLTKLDSAEDAAIVARAIIDAVHRPVDIAGQIVRTSVSIGISIYPDHGLTVTALKRNADTAMYCAKSRGRDGFQFYSDELDLMRGQRIALLGDLEHAVERNELRVLYQPIFDVVRDTMVGVEALLRWHHPVHGVIAPGQFIGYAEESGLLERLDHWTLGNALPHQRRWETLAGAPLPLSFNIGIGTLRSDDCVTRVTTLCARHHVPAGSVVLELNERALFHAADADLARLRLLRERGFQVSIDDFGSGYSALSYLPQCPVDAVKIDRAFVRDIAHDRYGAAAVRAIAAMAQSLELDIVAKGTEDWSQQNALLSMGIVTMQGYALARPMTAEELSRLLDARRVHAQAS
jgi:diguanylate cyclase (GGDEF)-like protein